MIFGAQSAARQIYTVILACLQTGSNVSTVITNGDKL